MKEGKYRNKMYVCRCVRQSGYVLEFSTESGMTYQCTQCKTISKNAIN